MALTKLKLALTLALALSLLGAGAGLAAFKAFTNEPAPIGRESVASAIDDQPAPAAKQPRVDLPKPATFSRNLPPAPPKRGCRNTRRRQWTG